MKIGKLLKQTLIVPPARLIHYQPQALENVSHFDCRHQIAFAHRV
jgi:hypothetical protein